MQLDMFAPRRKVLSTKVHTACKPHVCTRCNKTIKPAQQYIAQTLLIGKRFVIEQYHAHSCADASLIAFIKS